LLAILTFSLIYLHKEHYYNIAKQLYSIIRFKFFEYTVFESLDMNWRGPSQGLPTDGRFN